VTSTEAGRRLVLLSLLESAAQLQVRDGLVAAALCRDCWATIAELELGCHCEEAAYALIASAEHWMREAAA
jgi:hypothetical protein